MPVPHSIDEFLEGEDNTFKLSARRRLRKLSRRPGFECVLALGQAEISAGLDAMFTMHQERWHSLGLPSVFDSELLRTFYRKISPLMLEREWLELTVMKLDGEIVAALFGFVFEHRYYCLVNSCGVRGFEEKAGNALMLARIESLIGRATEFNFLRGDQPYKYQWGGRDRHTVNLCGWRGVEGWIAPIVLPTLRSTARRIKRSVNRKLHEPTRRLKKAASKES
jgi:CelD/BcsL family acetyltransferase involved in cellulose biosynthesis